MRNSVVDQNGNLNLREPAESEIAKSTKKKKAVSIGSVLSEDEQYQKAAAQLASRAATAGQKEARFSPLYNTGWSFWLRNTEFVDIKLRVPPQYELLILKRNVNVN